MAAPTEHSLIAVTFKHHPVTEEFKKVPPHITVLPWFDSRDPGVMTDIESAINETPPFYLTDSQPMIVGVEGHEKLTMTVESPRLQDLHQRLLQVVEGHGLQMPWRQWLGANYNPHYRLKDGPEAINRNRPIKVSEIAVVENIAVDGLGKGVKRIKYHQLEGGE